MLVTLPRVALIEDHPDNRLLVVSMFEDDYEFMEFETGVGIVSKLNENPPALILLDISLPDRDGFQVLTDLKEDGVLKNIPVIALTAHAMNGDRERILAAGFDGYVSKPMGDGDTLREAIMSKIPGEKAP